MKPARCVLVGLFVCIFIYPRLQALQSLDNSLADKETKATNACFKLCFQRLAKSRTSASLASNKKMQKERTSWTTKTKFRRLFESWCYHMCTANPRDALQTLGAVYDEDKILRRKKKQFLRNFRRRKREVSAVTMGQDCPSYQIYDGLHVGEIQNLSVAFTSREIDGNVTWFADISWRLRITNSTYYDDNRWSGFLVTWLTATKSNNGGGGPSLGPRPFCGFTHKNQTSVSIASVKGRWVYSDAIEVLVQTYPYPHSIDEQPSFIKFIPQGATPTMNVPTKFGSLSTTQVLTASITASKIRPTAVWTVQSTASITSTKIEPTAVWTVQSTASNTSTKIKPTSVRRVEQHGPFTEPIFPVVAIVIVIGTAVGGCLVALLIKHLRKRYLTKQARDMTSQISYEYDASIIYSHHDSTFVTKTLLPMLENQLNLRCCIHYRDWEIGREIHENIARTVYNSRYVIAAISKHFLESNFCKTELDMALERLIRLRDKSLLVINLDGVNKEALPMALRNKTFLDLSKQQERNNWERRLERQMSREDETTNIGQTAQHTKRTSIRIINNEGAESGSNSSRETVI